MKDTPETDAEADDARNLILDFQCQGEHDDIPEPIVVPVDFSRKLERERDEAIAELESWRSEKGPEGWWVKHEDHMAQLEEWRHAVRTLRDAKGRYHTEQAAKHLFSLLP